jgi:hypothetical protein
VASKCKDKLRVMICTSLYRIEGDIHLTPSSRVTDLLNVNAKDFMPVTDAVFYHPYENTVFARTEYTAVNRESILMLFPLGAEPFKGRPGSSETSGGGPGI